MQDFLEEESSVVKKEKEEILKKMQQDLSASGQSNLFFFDNLENLCVSYLEKSGYVVIKPRMDLLNYTIPSLVSSFYDAMTFKRKKTLAKDVARDNYLAKVFVESIIEMYECSQEAAIKICASIIRTVVFYESYFDFKNPITDFGVFAKANIAWLAKKSFEIMDNEEYFEQDLSREYEEQWDEFVSEYIENHGEDSLGFNI